MIADYAELENAGVVQNTAQFAKNATAQNLGNGTVGVYAPVQLANQLRDTVLSVSFSKP